jgi:phosphoglycerol transferase
MVKSKILGALWVLVLTLFIVLVWCNVRDRTTAETWGVPLDYAGDAPQIMAWFKAASEGDYIPFYYETAERLNAPYKAEWKDFPMYEKITIFFMGLVLKCIGVYQTSNFCILFAHILTAVSFYLCCRFLRHSRVWSFVGAAIFSFTYYHFFRNLSHVLLAFSYPLPWAVLSAWIIVSSKRIRMWDRLCWICVITGIVMGLSNPYNLNIYVQLICFAVVVQYFRKRRLENLRVGIWTIGVTGAAFIALNIGTVMYHWAHGQNPVALERNYFESELYALKPMEFFIPPLTHNIEAMANIGSYYISQMYVHGEATSPYLGVVGMAVLFWIFGESFLLIVRYTRRTKPFPPHALQITWIVLYSVIGGVNCVIALCGMKLFRSTDRSSIFVSCIIMLYFVSRMSVLSRRWPKAFNLGLAATILCIGVFDELPRPTQPEETAATERVVQSDLAFGQTLEQRLPHGAMVYELPVMSFPESPPVHDASTYEMMRPYLVTKTVRFSFGAVRGRNREAWQWEVQKMPAKEMIDTLESYGFNAILINRKGFADQGQDLLQKLAADGRADTFEDDAHQQVCIMLHPSATPRLPTTEARADFLFSKGWVIKDRTPLESRAWSGGDATVTFFSAPAGYSSYTVRTVMGSISQRHVSIMMDGREVWNAEVPPGQGVPVEFTISARHGNNKLEFTTDAKAVHTKETPLPLAFTIMNLEITRTSGM